MITLNRSAASQLKELAGAKAQAIATINSEIGAIRTLFITDIPGQGLIYTDKEREAIAYVAEDPAPVDLSDYPFITAEIGTTGNNAAEVAQVYLNMAALWRQVGTQLEQLRLGTIALVGAATDQTGINAAMAGFVASAEVFKNA